MLRKKTSFKKRTKGLQGRNAEKVASKIRQTQTIESSHGVNGLAQNKKIPARPPGGLE